MTDDRDPARVAIGAYLRACARRRGITDDAAAAALGKGASTVQRMYAGTVGTDGLILLRLVRLVGGDLGHISLLLDAPSLELAARLADEGGGIPPSAMALAARIGRAAAADPGLIPAVEGFVAGRISKG